jgi:hypothetical protein
MAIHNVFHCHLLILCPFNYLACNLYCNPYAEEISALARLVTHHQVWFMVIIVWLEHSASIVINFKGPTENGVSIFFNVVTQ